MSSSDWIIIPTIGENKSHVPNHQPVKHHWTPGSLEFHADPLSHDCLVMKVGHGGRVSNSTYPKHESFHDHNMYIYIYIDMFQFIFYILSSFGAWFRPQGQFTISRIAICRSIIIGKTEERTASQGTSTMHTSLWLNKSQETQWLWVLFQSIEGKSPMYSALIMFFYNNWNQQPVTLMLSRLESHS